MAGIGTTPVDLALARGKQFLLDRQGIDGLWREFRTLGGEGDDWPTGFVGAQLVGAGVRGSAIDRAVEALLRRQHRDGGWGYHRGVPTDADSTAWVLLLLGALDADRNAMERAGRCLERFQDPRSGGVATYANPAPIRRYLQMGPRADVSGWCACHLEVTATTGRAFARVPKGRFHEAAQRAWQYVARQQRPDGGWSAYWWVDRHYPTWQAVELAGVLGRAAVAARAADWARSALPCARTANQAFTVALDIAIRLRAGGPAGDPAGAPGTVARHAAGLIDLQQSDGGWPGHARMRIPPPGISEPESYPSWQDGSVGTGVVVGDHRRLFTTAVCVSALALVGRVGE